MSRFIHYEDLKVLAREKRACFSVNTEAFGLKQVREIYRKEGIRIDMWPLRPKVRAIYMCNDGDYSVAVNKTLPEEPRIFALIHELKHHYRDRDVIGSGTYICGDYNANREIEVGAEVFAAEFIFPEDEFALVAKAFEPKDWTPEKVVLFKRQCKAKISYAFISKRLEWLKLVPRGKFADVKFKKLEQELFGIEFYRRRQMVPKIVNE